MEVFRLAREKYAIPLSGKGAAIKGARWNSVIPDDIEVKEIFEIDLREDGKDFPHPVST